MVQQKIPKILQFYQETKKTYRNIEVTFIANKSNACTKSIKNTAILVGNPKKYQIK